MALYVGTLNECIHVLFHARYWKCFFLCPQLETRVIIQPVCVSIGKQRVIYSSISSRSMYFNQCIQPHTFLKTHIMTKGLHVFYAMWCSSELWCMARTSGNVQSKAFPQNWNNAWTLLHLRIANATSPCSTQTTISWRFHCRHDDVSINNCIIAGLVSAATDVQ